jgi:hypothetical protein
VKSLLSIYRYFFKILLASLCEGNSKDWEFCFLVSVRRYSFIFSQNTDLRFARRKIRGWEVQNEGLMKIEFG